MKRITPLTSVFRSSLAVAIALSVTACSDSELEGNLTKTKFEKWSVEKTLRQCERNENVCLRAISTTQFISRARDEQKVALCLQYPIGAKHLCLTKPLPIPEAKAVPKVQPLRNANFSADFSKALQHKDAYDRLAALQSIVTDTDNQRFQLAVSLLLNAITVNEPIAQYMPALFAIADLRHFSTAEQAVAYWVAQLSQYSGELQVQNRVKQAVNKACSLNGSTLYNNTDNASSAQVARAAFGCYRYFSDYSHSNGLVSTNTINDWAENGIRLVTHAMLNTGADIDWLIDDIEFSASDDTTRMAFTIFNRLLTRQGMALDNLIQQ